jgi:hypothetical protein
VAFDVAFKKPGTAVMLQFKLGEELRRFRKSNPSQTIPPLERPFWRFRIDPREAQFRNLAKYEEAGAEVYYVAPKFSDWKSYEAAFQAGEVLALSLKIMPSEVKRGIQSASGIHRVVYDTVARYVCSDPEPIEELSIEDLQHRIRTRITEEHSLESVIGRLSESQSAASQLPPDRRRDILRRARSHADGLALIVCLEAWSQGAQVVLVTSAD